MGGAGQSTN